jgi:hypothetical protein
MSIIEFQVTTSTFLAAQRTALRSLPLCPPRPMAVGPAQIIIDKIEFGNNAIRHNVLADFSIFYESLTSYAPGSQVEGYLTQIAQDVTIYVTTLNDILSRPNQPPLITVALQGTLVFSLNFLAFEEDCYITSDFEFLEPGPLPSLPPAWEVNINNLLDAVQKELNSLIPSKAIPAGLTTLTSIWSKFINAGVSVDVSLQRIAFRAQIGGSHPGVTGPWSYFLKGSFSDRLGGSDWAFFMDAGLLTEQVKATVNQELAEADVDHLQTFVGCTYSNGTGKAVFTLDVLGIYDLPDPLGTISRDPKVTMEISVSEPNTLKLLADYSGIISLIHSFDIIEFFLPSLSNGIEGFLQVLIGSALADLNKTEGAPYCKKISSTVVECKKTVQMPQITSGSSLIMTNLLALDDGISMVGTMKSLALTPTVLSTIVREFKWQPPKISCSSASLALVAAFQQSPSSFPVLHAEAVVDNQGTTPIYLCSWSVINDPLGAFPAAGIRVDAGPAWIRFSLDLPIPGDNYYQDGNRYPCDLLVKTTAGTRLLRIGPPPKIAQSDIDKLAAELLVKIGNCQQLIDEWFKHFHGYNPAWSVDPPFDARVDHLWQVEITGLQSGEMVSLVNSANQELVRASVKAGTPLRLSALLEPAGINELTVIRGGGPSGAVTLISKAKSPATRSPQGESAEDARGIEVGQHLLVQLGSVSLNEKCQSVQPTTIFARRCVIAVLRNGIKAYDFGNPRRPTLIRSWEIPGVRGVLTWQGALLFFGEDGFGWINGQGERKPNTAECYPNPILDVTAAAHVFYAVTSEGLEIYSTRLCKANVIAFDGGKCLARTAGKLVVGGRRGLFVYDIEDALHPSCGPSLEGVDVRAATRPLGSEAGTILASLEDGSARLLRIAGSELEETARFAQAPWFVGCARLGDLLVRIGKDGRSLAVSLFGKSQVI